MSHQNKQKVVARLRYLRNWETANVFLFPALLFFIYRAFAGESDFFFVYLLLVGAYILAQGSFYWHLKWRSVAAGCKMPDYFRRAFGFFRASNLVLIIGFLPAWFVASWRNRPGVGNLTAVALLFVFVVLEHINYYRLQLMHDNAADIAYLLRNKRLRQSALAADLSGKGER